MDNGVATVEQPAPPADLGGHDETWVGRVWDILDRRLNREHPRPLAVALSGGGDSLALTLIADAWARGAGRELLILSVDHGLQPQGRAWADLCAASAARLGRPFRALTWDGDKPAAGLPAAARAARHRLLADAAREAGATAVLMGHTADDRAEAAAMRAAGSTTPDPREWAPSPAWPQGRGVFLLRPLLDVRRADLRDWLSARDETWIDDPANADPRYARSRARAAAPSPEGRAEPPPLSLASAVRYAEGVLSTPRQVLRDAPADDVARLVALACVCAGGGERRPATARITRVADAIRGPGRFVSTLAGARIEADADWAAFSREPGEAARGGLQPLALPVGREVVWDGRFAVTADAPGLIVRPVARSSHPAIVDQDGSLRDSGARIRPLVGQRFLAAGGLVEREPA